MVTKLSFCHNQNYESNQKSSFTKVVQLSMPFKNGSLKVKVKLSFGHRAVILSVSKLNTESENFF